MGVINYTNDYSQLPHKIMDKHNFKDVTDEIAPIIEQVKTLQSQGKYAEAANVITNNNLKSYIMSAQYINQIDEETRNLEIMCVSKKQSIYYFEDEPGFVVEGDIWINKGE